jgi:chlorophyll synthase
MLLVYLGRPIHAALIALSLAVQIVLMARLIESPRERAPWYNATGISLYVLGMLVAAFALAPEGP